MDGFRSERARARALQTLHPDPGHHGSDRERLDFLDGHIQSRVDLRCNKATQAIELAKQFANDHDVELWQLDRQIETFRHTSLRPSLRQQINSAGAR